MSTGGGELTSLDKKTTPSFKRYAVRMLRHYACRVVSCCVKHLVTREDSGHPAFSDSVAGESAQLTAHPFLHSLMPPELHSGDNAASAAPSMASGRKRAPSSVSNPGAKKKARLTR